MLSLAYPSLQRCLKSHVHQICFPRFPPCVSCRAKHWPCQLTWTWHTYIHFVSLLACACFATTDMISLADSTDQFGAAHDVRLDVSASIQRERSAPCTVSKQSTVFKIVFFTAVVNTAVIVTITGTVSDSDCADLSLVVLQTQSELVLSSICGPDSWGKSKVSSADQCLRLIWSVLRVALRCISQNLTGD